MFYRRRFLLLLVTGLLAVGGLTTGCSASTSGDTAEHPFQMADLAPMPVEVQTAPVAVQQAYQFAVANPGVLKQIPCYCGCGDMGHTSNYACYVAGTNADGTLKYDPHALGCSICVDITQDTMRLLKQGKRVSEIRAVVDETYSRYGPSNMP
ncbi:MAG TPA: PCYCGC motif-containing (lipo)protein [Anaerolineae bacterium]|nr:PCYCGC motif-containing (lipo)protein [Anaerolineae bacterium]